MSLESLTGSSVYIDSLVVTNPVGASDPKGEGDDHLRGIKNTLKNTFPNITGPVTATHTEINKLDGFGGTLADKTGFSSSDDVIDNFPSGTLMLFQQTAAPTGWTKQTTHNDKALRVVSGTASSGGADAYSTVFARTATDSHTLITSEMPAHTHDVSVYTAGGGASTYVGINTAGSAETTLSAKATSTGGGGGHTHNLSNFNLQYVDLIIASKD